MRVFGIDPGSERTGYGCVETDGSRHRIVMCGAVGAPLSAPFSEKLFEIHRRLVELLAECRADSVAIENIFYATNVRSALKLGHARGVAMLAAAQAGLTVAEYTPAEIKRAVVGYGRAEKQQVQHMVKLLLGLTAVPSPHDAADALAVAICHVHSQMPARAMAGASGRLGVGGNSRCHNQGHELAPLPPRTPVIAHLRGRLSAKQPNRIVIDVNGVGYDVAVPLSTFYGLGDDGSEVALRIHTHVREETLALYGFATALELGLFEQLIGISGIGPKLALAVLSGIEPSELVRAIERADIARLTAIPGVGKKTSERMVIELKDRLPRLRPGGAAAGGDTIEPSALRDDVLSALVNLGYHRPLSEKAVDAAVKATPDGSFELTLKQALRELAR